ncbi:hypothetical protein QBC35DRAFT_475993, partial [Podospora australis]
APCVTSWDRPAARAGVYYAWGRNNLLEKYSKQQSAAVPVVQIPANCRSEEGSNIFTSTDLLRSKRHLLLRTVVWEQGLITSDATAIVAVGENTVTRIRIEANTVTEGGIATTSSRAPLQNIISLPKGFAAYAFAPSKCIDKHGLDSIISVDLFSVQPTTKPVFSQTRQLRKLRIKYSIGLVGCIFYFLDTSGCICSVEVQEMERASHYKRHFFIPPTWYKGDQYTIAILPESTVVFTRSDEVIAVQGFLDFEEKVPFSDDSLSRYC